MAEDQNSFNRESHLRSILKGFSWRVIAFIDTLVISLIVTWLIDGKPHIEAGLTIAGLEFLIKIAIYYIHDRAWQIAWKDGVVTPMETLANTTTWRVVATATTFVISGKVLGSFAGAALAIALTESISKFALFYYHERMWLKIPLGKIRSLVKKD